MPLIPLWTVRQCFGIFPTVLFNIYPLGDCFMSDQTMDLGSGIAAFETKFFSRAMQLLSPLAQIGNAEAQYRVAVMYQNGLGMAVNEKEAYRWMRAAAEQNHGLAQHGLGFMLMEGECTTQDSEAAISWFRRAAEQGLAGSQATLGMMYREGRGVPQDEAEARHWLRLAGFEEA